MTLEGNATGTPDSQQARSSGTLTFRAAPFVGSVCHFNAKVIYNFLDEFQED